MQVFRQYTANYYTLKQFPFKRELAMEAYLIENEAILRLDINDDDFSEVSVLDAEIALKEGRKGIGRDGRIDILVAYGSDTLGIVELKLGEIDQSALIQLEDYLEQAHKLLHIEPKYWKDEGGEKEPRWVGVLVGNSASKEIIEKIENGYQYKDIPIAIITLNRFQNEHTKEVVVVSDTYFKISTTARDYTKYLFLEQVYNKRRLANAIVKEYVQRNPETSYAELERQFPKRIQGSSGVIATKERAEQIYGERGRKRHLLNPEDLIQLADGTIVATCSRWRLENIQRMIEHARKLMPDLEITAQ